MDQSEVLQKLLENQLQLQQQVAAMMANGAALRQPTPNEQGPTGATLEGSRQPTGPGGAQGQPPASSPHGAFGQPFGTPHGAYG